MSSCMCGLRNGIGDVLLINAKILHLLVMSFSKISFAGFKIVCRRSGNLHEVLPRLSHVHTRGGW